MINSECFNYFTLIMQSVRHQFILSSFQLPPFESKLSQKEPIKQEVTYFGEQEFTGPKIP